MNKNSPADEEILSLLQNWFEALKSSGNPDKVTSLYAADAVLVPTLWNGPCYGANAIRNYFKAEFLPAHPEGYLVNYSITRAGDVVINSGHYVFMIDNHETEKLASEGNDKINPCEKRVKKSARFTFVYRKTGQKWLIIAHHSSKMPEERSTTILKWVKSDCFVA